MPDHAATMPDMMRCFEAYLDPRHQAHFLPRFQQFMAGGRRWTFNLGAAFWSFFWFFYHKMYAWGLAGAVFFMGLDAAVGQVLDHSCGNIELLGFVRFVAPMVASVLLVGFWADWLYYRHCQRRIKRLWRRHAQLDEAAFLALLARRGGVNLKGILWVIVPILVLAVALMIVAYVGDPVGTEHILTDGFVPAEVGCAPQ